MLPEKLQRVISDIRRVIGLGTVSFSVNFSWIYSNVLTQREGRIGFHEHLLLQSIEYTRDNEALPADDYRYVDVTMGQELREARSVHSAAFWCITFISPRGTLPHDATMRSDISSLFVVAVQETYHSP